TALNKVCGWDGEVNDYRREARTLGDVAAWSDGQVNLAGDGEPERVAYGSVTANLFAVLGASPLMGRTFAAGEDAQNGPNLVVLGYGLWQRRYGADPNIIGRRILINGTSCEVIGVM